MLPHWGAFAARSPPYSPPDASTDPPYSPSPKPLLCNLANMLDLCTLCDRSQKGSKRKYNYKDFASSNGDEDFNLQMNFPDTTLQEELR